MIRRDVVRMIPISVAGLAGISEKSHAASEDTATNTMSAQVKQYNGAPTLFLDGKPAFFASQWTRTPTKGSKLTAEKSDIHIYAVDVGVFREYYKPGERASVNMDFSTVAELFESFIKSDPHARFHMRLQCEVGEKWWTEFYPQECEVTSLGKQPRQSFASQVWRKQVNDFLKAYAEHIQSIGMANRIVAYQVGAGHTGEWVKRRSSMAVPCGDYSDAMRRCFRAYLRKKYKGDVYLFREAWNNSDITFETAEVPSAGEQLRAKNYIFRDPSLEQNVIDYFRCLADLCSDLIIEFCQTVKETTGGKAPTAVFYGYLMELAWNSGFFAEWLDRWTESDYSTYQRCGHLGLRKVLKSPHIDFLVSPYSYGFRGIGGDGPTMLPAESARIHGKLVIIEDDTRLHGPEDTAYGRAMNLKESTAFLRRNFDQMIARGQVAWWRPTEDTSLFPVLKDFTELGAFSLQTDRMPSSEIAVLLDDESFYYETSRNNLDVPLITKQRLEGLVRFGAPFDTYLLDDFIEGLVKPYKLYLFLNCFRLDGARREALKNELRRDNRIAVWMYAPGYIKDDLSMEHMTDLTGFTFEMSRQPWSVSMHIIDFNHPITSGIPQDLFWGTHNLLSPVFYLKDPDARILGQVVHAQGRCVPGMGVKVFPKWTSVFISAPNVPAPLLRGLAHFAGVHLYNEEGDVLYASPQLLGVHTVSGGNRIFKLPRKVQEVFDLYENKTIARNTDTFKVKLPPISTTLYYTGDSGLLSQLKKG